MEQQIATETPKAENLNQELRLGRRLSIIVIDDDPFFCKLVSTALDPNYFAVHTFNSLPDVGNISELGNYDIALLDYYLPAVSGIEIAEYVDAFFKDMPVILVSAGQPGKEENFIWPGCIQKYVCKSYGIKAVVDAVLDVACSRNLLQ